MSSPAPGTTRYLCPLECGWHHDVPPPSPADLAGIVPHPTARDMSEAVSSIASQAAFRQLERTEEALRGHLDTHTTVEFARVIHDLRVEVEQLRGAGPVRPDEEPTT